MIWLFLDRKSWQGLVSFTLPSSQPSLPASCHHTQTISSSLIIETPQQTIVFTSRTENKDKSFHKGNNSFPFARLHLPPIQGHETKLRCHPLPHPQLWQAQVPPSNEENVTVQVQFHHQWRRHLREKQNFKAKKAKGTYPKKEN